MHSSEKDQAPLDDSTLEPRVIYLTWDETYNVNSIQEQVLVRAGSLLNTKSIASIIEKIELSAEEVSELVELLSQAKIDSEIRRKVIDNSSGWYIDGDKFKTLMPWDWLEYSDKKKHRHEYIEEASVYIDGNWYHGGRREYYESCIETRKFVEGDNLRSLVLYAISKHYPLEEIKQIHLTFLKTELDSIRISFNNDIEEETLLVYSKNGNNYTRADMILDEWHEQQEAEQWEAQEGQTVA